jgi:predicted lipoprotein with Yx(FWY)xxD motif
MKRPILGGLLALTVAGCGAAAPHATPARATATAVDLHPSSLGPILVTGTGRTLYLFRADRGTHSVCTGACASAWPPLLSKGHPVAGRGVHEALLGTSVRAGGARQVTYHGHPLYRFAGDSGPGQTNGEGSRAFGALWEAVNPAGGAVPASAHGHVASAPGPAW